MRIQSTKTVLEAAQKRIARLFDEFADVAVAVSGGKDSTVVLELTLAEAARRKRGPTPVIFIDQEAEWGCVIDYVRKIMNRPDVTPMWVQVPIDIENATSADAPLLHCWRAGDEWMRPKEPNALTEDVYGTRNFYDLFGKIVKHHWSGKPVAVIGGVRCEESPSRFVGLTTKPTYLDITWGKVHDARAKQFTFYPIYDWGWRDVWKAIHDHNWDYCKLYDWYYQKGVHYHKMRVSSLHHETSTDSLIYLQEFEPPTWKSMQRRLRGINTHKHMGREWKVPKHVPPMFSGWREYRDHLLTNLISNPIHRKGLQEQFSRMEQQYAAMGPDGINKMLRVHVGAVFVNDWECGTICKNWENRSEVAAWRQWFFHGKRDARMLKNTYIQETTACPLSSK